jgi:probable rRNA maturation factor
LSLAFVSDRTIRSLNRRFLKRNHVTDVLAFDYREKGKRAKRLEGEVIISTDTAVRQARKFGTGVKQELTLYIIHGILHLLGYDDHRPKDIKRMRAKEQKILKTLI